MSHIIENNWKNTKTLFRLNEKLILSGKPADPHFNKFNRIDMIMGLFWDFQCIDRNSLRPNNSILQRMG